MPNLKNILFLIPLSLALTACNEQANVEENADNQLSEEADDTQPIASTEFNGVYNFSYGPLSNTDENGDACARGASGTISLSGAQLSGSVTDINDGSTYTVSSQLRAENILSDEDGTSYQQLTVQRGTFATDDNTIIAGFIGAFSYNTEGIIVGFGTYEGVKGCFGMWAAEPNNEQT